MAGSVNSGEGDANGRGFEQSSVLHMSIGVVGRTILNFGVVALGTLEVGVGLFEEIVTVDFGGTYFSCWVGSAGSQAANFWDVFGLGGPGFDFVGECL